MPAGLRWFGTFVFSDGGRTIFFPGLRDRQHLTRTAKGGSTPIEHQFEAEHFSLERDRREWHVTDSGKDEHKGRFPRRIYGEGRVLWFGLSLASSRRSSLGQAFRPPKSNAQIPPGDSRRRADVLTQAREGILFNTLLLSESQPEIDGFCHFAVIAGPHGFAPYRGNQLGVPFGSPFVAPPLGNLQSLFLRSHRLSLEPHVDIEIVTASLPGRVIVARGNYFAGRLNAAYTTDILRRSWTAPARSVRPCRCWSSSYGILMMNSPYVLRGRLSSFLRHAASCDRSMSTPPLRALRLGLPRLIGSG